MTELERLEWINAKLVDCLRWLYDLSAIAGCPLEKHREDWERTMKEAQNLLKEKDEVRRIVFPELSSAIPPH